MTAGLRGHNMKSASLAAAVLVSLTMPAIAQQQAPTGPTAQEEALKRNVQVFEMALRSAIIDAGVKVADWARKIEPSVVLRLAILNRRLTIDPAPRTVPVAAS